MNGKTVTWVFNDAFVPAAKITGDGSYSIISNYLGTPVEAYDLEGERVWSAELDIYGRVKEFTGEADFVPFRYQGQYEDAETGLYYNRFRYYDPETGQYTQQDPIGLAGANPTLYGYVWDTNWWIDIFGLTSIAELVEEAHSLLDPISQNMKTTAIGANTAGDLFIASSVRAVPTPQQAYAISNNISIVNGVGHAEATLINSGNSIVHVEASRPICLDCENLMNQNGVTTTTPKSGKPSRNSGGCGQ